MSDFFTPEQLKVLDQSFRGKQIKIEILNSQYKVLDTIEGYCSEGSSNSDANSDNRKSFNLKLVIDTKYTDILRNKYIVSKDGLIWIDKYIRIYVGIKNLQTDQYVWFNNGMYIIDAPNYSYSADDHTLSINGLDLMSNLSDTRKGQLTNIETVIPAYETVNGIETQSLMRDVIISVIKDYAYINKYYIAEIPVQNQYVPENLTFEAGSTIYSILSKLLKYLPNWEMFFDNDGMFIMQPIPSGENDVVYPLNSNNTQVEEVSVDFGNVKNLIVVRGKTHDTDYFLANNYIYQDTANNALRIGIDKLDITKFGNNTTLGFVWNEYGYNVMLNQLWIYNNSLATIIITKGTNLSNATVGITKLLSQINTSVQGSQSLAITYNGNNWTIPRFPSGALIVDLKEYGITVEGTPQSGDILTVTYTIPILNQDYYVYTLTDFEGQPNYIAAQTFQPDSIIVLRYRNLTSSSINYWDFLSNGQAEGYAVTENIDSPFYINNELIGENYYGGLSICSNHYTYQIELNNQQELNAISTGTQITFMPNIVNYQFDSASEIYTTLKVSDGLTHNEIYGVNEDETSKLLGIQIGYLVGNTFTPLPEKKFDGDFTIYILTYKTYIDSDGNTKCCFNLDGRLQTYTSYLSGGDYENIYSNSLAKQTADYQLYLHSNLNDTVTLTTVPAYYMDVNKKINYTELSTNENSDFLTKTISFPYDATGSTMTINAMRIFPEQYYLTLEADVSSNLIVTRNGYTLTNNQLIKQGDVLNISATINNLTPNYKLNIFVNGISFINGNNYVVIGNTTVSTTVFATSSLLTLNNDASLGTLIVQDANGNIYNSGDYVENNSILTITNAPIKTYRTSILYVNGSIYTDSTYTITSNTVIGTTYAYKTLEESSWDAINEAGIDGVQQAVYPIESDNNIKNISLSTGETIQVRIIGYNKYTTTNNNQIAPYVFQMVNCFNTLYPMNTSENNLWKDCTLRTQTIPIIYNQLPSELTQVMKTSVIESYHYQYGGAVGVITNDNMFLLGGRQDYDNTFAYFTNKTRWIKQSNGANIAYFTRGHWNTSNINFDGISTDGTRYVDLVGTDSHGIALTFCV